MFYCSYMKVLALHSESFHTKTIWITIISFHQNGIHLLQYWKQISVQSRIVPAPSELKAERWASSEGDPKGAALNRRDDPSPNLTPRMSSISWEMRGLPLPFWWFLSKSARLIIPEQICQSGISVKSASLALLSKSVSLVIPVQICQSDTSVQICQSGNSCINLPVWQFQSKSALSGWLWVVLPWTHTRYQCAKLGVVFSVSIFICLTSFIFAGVPLVAF